MFIVNVNQIKLFISSESHRRFTEHVHLFFLSRKRSDERLKEIQNHWFDLGSFSYWKIIKKKKLLVPSQKSYRNRKSLSRQGHNHEWPPKIWNTWAFSEWFVCVLRRVIETRIFRTLDALDPIPISVYDNNEYKEDPSKEAGRWQFR